jgi:formamidopyrimidine-DNA glycosylase
VRGEAALAEHDPGGLEVQQATFAEFHARMTAENRTLKRALTDPHILSGIGNAYSDEILHRARLSPVTLTSRLGDEEWRRLHGDARDPRTLDRAAARAGRRGLPREGHRLPARDGRARALPAAVPRLRRPRAADRYAANETNYCARCQTGGKLLADRALSQLMKKDWPKSLEELEAKRRR